MQQRKVIKAAESPRGKWRLELQDCGDGSYRVATLKRGEEQGCRVRYGAEQAEAEFQRQVALGPLDGINYREA